MASPPHLPAAVLHPGISFTPEDDELITLCLRLKAAREPLPPPGAQFVHDADVYAADPANLVAGFPPASARTGESMVWYFFCYPKAKSTRGSRKSRTIGEGGGTWHSEYRKDVADGEGCVVGYRRSFSHETSGGEKSGWLMMEYGFCDDDNQENQEVSPVLCKVYQSTRQRRSAEKSSSSRSALKRKAEDKISDTGWSARSRRKLVFPSPSATNPATPPTMGTATPEDLLHETPALLMSADHTRSLLSCKSHGNNAILTPIADESPPENSVLQPETTWTLDQSFFSPHHTGSEPSCHDTLLPSAEISDATFDQSFFSPHHTGSEPSCHDTLLPSAGISDGTFDQSFFSPHHAGPSAEISDGMALLLPWAYGASPSCTPYAETSLAPLGCGAEWPYGLPFQC